MSGLYVSEIMRRKMERAEATIGGIGNEEEVKANG
jgi:hypothetical protein